MIIQLKLLFCCWVYTWMFIKESLIDDWLSRRKKFVLSGDDCRSCSQNIRRAHAYPWSLDTMRDVSAVIRVTRCKFPGMNIKIKTGKSRWTLNECFMSILVRRRALPHNFHSSSLRELSMKGSIDRLPCIIPACDGATALARRLQQESSTHVPMPKRSLAGFEWVPSATKHQRLFYVCYSMRCYQSRTSRSTVKVAGTLTSIQIYQWG